MGNFSFNASGAPTTPATSAATPAPTVDTNEMMKMFMQMMNMQQQQGQARLGLQHDAMFGRHLGIGGGEMTPENPTGNPANPWGKDGAFHGGFASQMSPEALAASSGSTAVNQWNNPQMFHGNAWRGPTPTAAQGQVLDRGYGPTSSGGMTNFMGPAGPSIMYNPSYDKADGISGILGRYDPALSSTPRQLKKPTATSPRGIPRMF